MNEIFDKISSYNIFNYLLPGTLFAAISDEYSSYSFIQDDVLLGVFYYYFIGLVISRVGSLVIEPFLKKIGFLKFTEYEKFLTASQVDEKLDELSEANNMYRTMCSLFIFVLGILVFDAVASSTPYLRDGAPYVVAVVLLFLFIFSYRKQTRYIVKRVNRANEDK